jgi:hypothetical protein
MTPDALFTLWKELTGESWRILPYLVQEQAMEFCRADFTAEEVRLVVAYTRREIARASSGFNPQSLTWRVLAADQWAKFQERLTLAREADKRRPLFRRDVPVTRQIAPGVTETKLEREPAAEPARVDVASAFRQMADQIGRRKP